MIRAEAVVPRKPNVAAMWAALVAGVEKTGKESKTRFNSHVKDWDGKPAFKEELKGTRPLSGEISHKYAATDQILTWTVRGTKGPYPIPKAGPGWLGIREGYTRKSLPGVIPSRPGGAFGKKKAIFAQVEHPGITGTEVDKNIRKEVEPLFKRNMRDAMVTAAKASGHGR